MARASLARVHISGKANRKYPSSVELWYQTGEEGSPNFLVVPLENKNRKIYFLSPRMVVNTEANLPLDLSAVDMIWDKFFISPIITYEENPIRFNHKYWEDGNKLFSKI